MKDMSKFQIVLVAVFIVFTIAGVIIFATTKAKNAIESVNVEAWGLLDAESFSRTVAAINTGLGNPAERLHINYTQKDPVQFHTEILEAIADGRSPDIVILPQDYIVKYINRLALIPYQIYTSRLFSDSFTEGSEIFKLPNGIAALPLSADPMVMYWNRDIFNSFGVPLPPKNWEEFFDLAKRFTTKDDTLRVDQSFVALGEYNNIDHAKDIISLLALQRGDTITTWNGSGQIIPTGNSDNLEKVLTFYTSFSDPSRETYSWNRSLPSSKEFFLLGKSAIYIGYASELRELKKKNPNLNFDMAAIPQFKDQPKQTTYGKLYGLAVLRTSPHVNEAIRNIMTVTGAAGGKAFADNTGFPPVRRDLLANRPSDRYGSILYTSSLLMHGWLDPDPVASSKVFGSVIDVITSGEETVSTAISRMNNELTQISNK
jgi:ABC-type glycerol-3-phosphate transport system substrate-binding protein